jgi:hypothetical protein
MSYRKAFLIGGFTVAFGFAGQVLALSFFGGGDGSSGPPTNTIDADENDTICSSQRGNSDLAYKTIVIGEETFFQVTNTADDGPGIVFCGTRAAGSTTNPFLNGGGENCQLTGYVGPVTVETDTSGDPTVITETLTGIVSSKDKRFTSTLKLTCPTIGNGTPEKYGLPTKEQCTGPKNNKTCVEVVDLTKKEIGVVLSDDGTFQEGQFALSGVVTEYPLPNDEDTGEPQGTPNVTPLLTLLRMCNDDRTGFITCFYDLGQGDTRLQSLNANDTGAVDLSANLIMTPGTLNVSNNSGSNVVTGQIRPCPSAGVVLETDRISGATIVIRSVNDSNNDGLPDTYSTSDQQLVGVDPNCPESNPQEILQFKANRNDVIDAYNLTTENVDFDFTIEGFLADPGDETDTRFTATYGWRTN